MFVQNQHGAMTSHQAYQLLGAHLAKMAQALVTNHSSSSVQGSSMLLLDSYRDSHLVELEFLVTMALLVSSKQ